MQVGGGDELLARGTQSANRLDDSPDDRLNVARTHGTLDIRLHRTHVEIDP